MYCTLIRNIRNISPYKYTQNMPKVTIKFTLPEEENEYKIMSQSSKTQRFLWDFSQQLRAWQKYHHDFKDANDALDKIREEFYRLINEHNINLDL